MKRNVTLTGLIIIATMVSAQLSNFRGKTIYGAKFNQFSTQSGFGYHAGVDMFVESYGRILEAGIFTNGSNNTISGIDVQYTQLFKSKKFKISSTSKFIPLVSYSFIYRNTNVSLATSKVQGQLSNYVNASVTSIEHYLAIGARYNMSRNLFMEGTLGFGGYLGSIQKTQYRTKVLFDVKGKDSFGMIGKLTVGVKLF